MTAQSDCNDLNGKALFPVQNSKILVVGAGGIGCEILKNLCLSGFKDIEIIDLDTIDVSNLNRQFLFRKEHVGKSKAVVAKDSVLAFNSKIKIEAHHDSIFSQSYGVNFFKKFHVVLNALDNRAARNHVNRMCLAADVPLVESGTAGYSGQVELIKKGLTQCYECQPKPHQRSFPGCTIRNTPSEPVHCIVWAKHLFNQLFGEEDPDQDVSPDTEDPEAKEQGKFSETETGNVKRKSTRQWANEIEYDAEKLFNKFFQDDIKYLLSMENLWKTRRAPNPISWNEAINKSGNSSKEEQNKPFDMQMLSIRKCCEIFGETIKVLKQKLQESEFLIWDKDDKTSMNFVAACANIRSHIFGIPGKTIFMAKSIAGNIIPAIATANALIAGLAVLYGIRVLNGGYKKCSTIYLRQKSLHSKVVLAADKTLQTPNPRCYVCSPKPLVDVFINTDKMTIKEFETEILKNGLNMVAPDAFIEGKGVVIISSEEEEMQSVNKKMSEMGVVDGSILRADDFLQNYELTININHYEANGKDEPLYKIEAHDELKAKPFEETTENGVTSKNELLHDDSEAEPSSSKRRKLNPPNDDDDIVIVEELLL